MVDRNVPKKARGTLWDWCVIEKPDDPGGFYETAVHHFLGLDSYGRGVLLKAIKAKKEEAD